MIKRYCMGSRELSKIHPLGVRLLETLPDFIPDDSNVIYPEITVENTDTLVCAQNSLHEGPGMEYMNHICNDEYINNPHVVAI